MYGYDYMHVNAVPLETRRGRQIPQDWRYRLWVTPLEYCELDPDPP